MTTRKRLNEVLNETFKYYYGKQSRCGYSDSGMCEYLTEEGNKCAIGRMLRPSYLKEKADQLNEAGPVEDAYDKGLLPTEAFLPRYQGLPFIFLKQLQTMHDDYAEWGDKDKMEQIRDRIKQHIKEGVYNGN